MSRTNATACYRELGNELRKRREAAGLQGQELGRRIAWSNTKISRVESGKINISQVDMIHYLGGCRVFLREAHELMELCKDAMLNVGYFARSHGEWLEDSVCSLIYHESTADASTSYEPLMVPGLLQTESYARAMIRRDSWRSEENVEHCVRARMERRHILYRPNTATFTFYLHEHALRLTVGDESIMRDQMLALMRRGNLPHVRFRVVPEAAWFGGAFRLFQFAEHRPLVYLDGHASGLFLEDKDFVEPYRALIQVVADTALDEGQSRQVVADLANGYDRGSTQGHVEEKQP